MIENQAYLWRCGCGSGCSCGPVAWAWLTPVPSPSWQVQGPACASWGSPKAENPGQTRARARERSQLCPPGTGWR